MNLSVIIHTFPGFLQICDAWMVQLRWIRSYSPEHILLQKMLTRICCRLSMIANAPLSTFSTIIVADLMGFSGLNSLLLTMPVGAFAGTSMLLCSWCAMRCRNARSYIYFGAQMVTVLSALLLWLLPSSAVGGLLFGLYILPGVGAGYSVLMGHQIANTAGYTKRSLAASGIFIGYCLGKYCGRLLSTFLRISCYALSSLDIRGLVLTSRFAGNVVGPLVFRTQDKPGYDLGFIVVVITSIVAAFLGLAYRFICVWDNRKRDKVGVMEGFDDAFNDDLTDKKVRYTHTLRGLYINLNIIKYKN